MGVLRGGALQRSVLRGYFEAMVKHGIFVVDHVRRRSDCASELNCNHNEDILKGWGLAGGTKIITGWPHSRTGLNCPSKNAVRCVKNDPYGIHVTDSNTPGAVFLEARE